jgi:hypothetical protein
LKFKEDTNVRLGHWSKSFVDSIHSWSFLPMPSLVQKLMNEFQLFSQKIDEIAMERGGRKKMMENDLFHSLRAQEHRLLESVVKMENLLTYLTKWLEAKIVIKEGNGLMMDLFLTLKKLCIISDEQLAHFLNNENKGQFILSYAINRLPHPPLDELDDSKKKF